MIYLVSNNGRSRLATGVTAGAMALTLDENTGGRFPLPDTGQAFWVRVGSTSLYELRLCTGRAGDTLFLAEPLDMDWQARTAVILPVNAELLEAFVQRPELGSAATHAAEDFATPGAVALAMAAIADVAGSLGNDPQFAATMASALAGKQPLNALLTALSGLTNQPDYLPYLTGSGMASTALTVFARSLLAADNATAVRALLGLGGAALLNVGSGVGQVAAGDHTHSMSGLTGFGKLQMLCQAHMTGTVPALVGSVRLPAGDYQAPAACLGCADPSVQASLQLLGPTGTVLATISRTGTVDWTAAGAGLTLAASTTLTLALSAGSEAVSAYLFGFEIQGT